MSWGGSPNSQTRRRRWVKDQTMTRAPSCQIADRTARSHCERDEAVHGLDQNRHNRDGIGIVTDRALFAGISRLHKNVEVRKPPVEVHHG
jgi:hypothetical protein